MTRWRWLSTAGMRVAQTIRAAQGLPTTLQPGQIYAKGRTALAGRSIQTVRAQGKCLINLEDKMRVKFPGDHPLRAWPVTHGAWLLKSYHVASSRNDSLHEPTWSSLSWTYLCLW